MPVIKEDPALAQETQEARDYLAEHGLPEQLETLPIKPLVALMYPASVRNAAMDRCLELKAPSAQAHWNTQLLPKGKNRHKDTCLGWNGREGPCECGANTYYYNHSDGSTLSQPLITVYVR